MADDLHPAFAQLRDAVLDDEHLVRALASGRRRGQPQPRWRRVELRYVDLKAGRHLQVTTYDETQAHVTNRKDAAAAMDELLAEPFANWHVETASHTHQLRVTKKGEPLLHTSERAEPVTPQRSHDHTKQRLLPEDHPVLDGARHLRRTGPGEAVPPGEVPPGRGVPASARSGHRGRDPHRQAAHADAGGPAAGGRPRLRQRLPDLRRARVAERAGSPCVSSVSTSRSSPGGTTPRSPRSSASPTSCPSSPPASGT